MFQKSIRTIEDVRLKTQVKNGSLVFREKKNWARKKGAKMFFKKASTSYTIVRPIVINVSPLILLGISAVITGLYYPFKSD